MVSWSHRQASCFEIFYKAYKTIHHQQHKSKHNRPACKQCINDTIRYKHFNVRLKLNSSLTKQNRKRGIKELKNKAEELEHVTNGSVIHEGSLEWHQQFMVKKMTE